MSLTVGGNSAQQFGLRINDINSKETENTLGRLASGLRINKAADDAAGLGISERLRALSNGFAQAESNLQSGISTVQVAEGGLSSINDSLQRMRELSVQASNDTLTNEDRLSIQGEINQLAQEIDRQAGATQFNGQPLLSGQFSAANGGLQVQAGANEGDTMNVAIEQTDTSKLGVSGVDVSTQGGAENAVSSIDAAISSVSGQLATIGSVQNRIESAITFVGTARENTNSALSQVRDANMAQEAVGLSILKIRNQTGLAAIGQGNLNSQSVLKLLNG